MSRDLSPTELENLVLTILKEAPGQKADASYITRRSLDEQIPVLRVMNTLTFMQQLGLVARGFKDRDGEELTEEQALALCRGYEARHGLPAGKIGYQQAGINFYWAPPR